MNKFSFYKIKRKMSLILFIILIMVFSLHQNISSSRSNLVDISYHSDISFNSIKIQNSAIVNLTFFYIADLHGWIQPHDGYGGVATLMGYFKQDGYESENDTFLIFSGGDHNTGPAEATLSKGAAIIDVMNAMNFTAAAIGNHEFDYGYEVMEMQKERADFPLLACNIFDKGTTNIANFSTPYVIQEHAGIKIGIIGITIKDPNPQAVYDYDFGDYELSLRTTYDVVISKGADVIIVLSHLTPSDMDILASNVEDLKIELFFGGHAHVPCFYTVDNSLIVSTEPYDQQYAKIVVSINNDTKSIIAKNGGLFPNIEGGAPPDTSIQQVVDYWVNQVNASEVITHASTNIYDGVPESAIGNLITDGFLYHFNWEYSFGVTNRGGGYRDYFREGNITLGDIVSVIPFENNLLELTMTGEQILQMLYQFHGHYTYSGIRYRFYYNPNLVIHSVKIYENDGFYDLSLTKTYTGVMTDFNWWQNHYGKFSAVDTGVHYRDTVVEYFRTLSDLVPHGLDERILETTEELPIINEYISKNIIISLICGIVVYVLWRRIQIVFVK